jgi:acyl-CoA thioesterase-2
MSERTNHLTDDIEPVDSPQKALAELLSLLDLERIEEDIFRGVSPKDRWQRVFGGQVLGQALIAASRTVEGRLCHSLHAYFLRPGDPRKPIVYEVDRSRDGSSFTARRVVAIQHGRPIFTMSASFQVEEQGLEHQTAMPDVPDPDSLKSEREWRSEILNQIPEHVRPWFLRPRPIEFRPVEPLNRFGGGKLPPRQTLWLRAVDTLPADKALHQAVLAHASDMTLLDTSLLPHGLTLWAGTLQTASLDHAMWFHRPFHADEWLLYVQESTSAAGGRGFNRGAMFRRDGSLVASVAQEGLIRVRTSL